MARVFQHLSQLSLDSGHIPALWKLANIVPRPENANPNQFKEFRPVALTSVALISHSFKVFCIFSFCASSAVCLSMIIVGILGIILRAVLQSSIQNKYFFITYKIRDHLFVYYPCRPQDYTYDSSRILKSSPAPGYRWPCEGHVTLAAHKATDSSTSKSRE